MDALGVRTLSQLGVFTSWLSAHGITGGYIGEAGWPNGPDAAKWNLLGESFLSACDAAGLWVTYFGVGDTFGDPAWVPGLPAYVAANGSTTAAPLAQAAAQAAQLEKHLSTPTKRIRTGVNYIGGEYPLALKLNAAAGVTDPASNVRERPGWTFGLDGPYDATDRYAHQWSYGRRASFDFLASRGVDLIRLPMRWERVQRVLGGPLDTTEMARIDAAIAAAGAAGLAVIPDIHNFGTYFLDNGSVGVSTPLGTGTVTTAAFADLWSRLSAHWKTNQSVLAYDLMNEPASASVAAWQAASQAAVTAIRANSDTKKIMVAGGGGGDYGSAYNWAAVNGNPWITDSASNFLYEAHHYFDGSDYPRNYAAAVANAVAGGYADDSQGQGIAYTYSTGYPVRN
jgi:hypothetical protein